MDPKCGYIHQALKRRLGSDGKTLNASHGIITRVNCYPANQRGNDIILGYLKGQPSKYQNNTMKKGFCYEEKTDCFVCRQGNI